MLSSRPGNLHTDGRLLAKTPGRENAIYRGVMTGYGKSKNNAITPLHPNTLQPQRFRKEVVSSKFLTRTVARPLGDKTPFTNRDAPTTPLPGAQKIAKLVLLDAPKTHVLESLHPNNTPDSVARPSSMRKHVRAPRSASKNRFETPLTNGNHWEVSASDLIVPEAEAPEVPPFPEADDYDEIEYMPPKAVETPYTPPFDLPDYASVGTTLFRLAHSYPYDDTTPPEIEPTVDLVPWDMFALPDIVRKTTAAPRRPLRSAVAPSVAVALRRPHLPTALAKPEPPTAIAKLRPRSAVSKPALSKPPVSRTAAPTVRPRAAAPNTRPRAPLPNATSRAPPPKAVSPVIVADLGSEDDFMFAV
ncbi:hypothetical protein B0H10DRAFT_1378744 [Mycena sp. CBHHK59/15]|nr:hypothetical protein B0H10DRAFT_1378744 [Mycena sp. CBHHK59/15]